MDDLTTLTMTKACTVWLLRKLQVNNELAWMKIKLSKSRSISIVKGKLSDQHLLGFTGILKRTILVLREKTHLLAELFL